MIKIQCKITGINCSYSYDENGILSPLISLELKDPNFLEKRCFVFGSSAKISLTLNLKDFFDLTGIKIEWNLNSMSSVEDAHTEMGKLIIEIEKIEEILSGKTFESDLGIKKAVQTEIEQAEKSQPNKNEILVHFPRHFTLETAKHLCLRYVFETKYIKSTDNWNDCCMLLITIPKELNSENILKIINEENKNIGIFAVYNFESCFYSK